MVKVALIVIVFIINFTSICIGQDNKTSDYQIKKLNDGFYFLYIDSSNIKKNITKSVILEFQDFVMLIDLPISYGGAGTKKLTDYVDEGYKIINFINSFFPNKPLKYFLASHWHPHCISSIEPFIKNDIKVILSQKNYDKVKEMIDSTRNVDYAKIISIVNQDEYKIEDNYNSIIVYKIEKKDYEYLPTEEFLYFYMPKYNYFHTSCMYQRYKGTNILGKEVVSPRTEDLSKFLKNIQLTPNNFICDDTFFDEENGLISVDTFNMIMKNGIKFSDMKNKIIDVSKKTGNNFDSTIDLMIINKFPTSLLNSMAYKYLKDKDYQSALFFSRIQIILNPSNPNYWDTYGEVYYFMGNKEMAKRYENECKKLDKNFEGGEKVWELNYKEYNK